MGDAIERGSRMRLAKCKLVEGGCRVRAKVAARASVRMLTTAVGSTARTAAVDLIPLLFSLDDDDDR